MNSQLVRWNPFKQLDRLEKRLGQFPFGRLFEDEPIFTHGEESIISAQWCPSVDISEDDKEFLVKADLPDLRREDVRVSVDDGTLTLSGERKIEKEEKNKRYHRVEREYGSFIRNFTLPAGIAADKVAAEFKDGVLRVHLPKDTKPATKSVTVPIS